MKTNLTQRLAAMAAVALITLTLIPSAEARRGRGLFNKYFRADANIVQKLEQRGNFTILLTALETAGLKETVASAELTLLAPTDDAFADLLAELDVSAGDLLANPDLADILLYHVIGGKNRIGLLTLRSTATTLSNDQPVLFKYATMGNRSFNVNQAKVIRPNLRASNGYIQIIDSVLLPPTEPIALESTLDVLRLDGRFSVLLLALETAGLEEAVEQNELTLFAPTDEAFVALLDQLDISAGDLLANPDLSSILLYHVVGGSQRAFSLLIGGQAETLQGDDVFADFMGGRVNINDSEVINPNIVTPTGLIHVIDAVLLP